MEMKLLKNADAKNNKSKRKKIKAKMDRINSQFINKEHKEILKDRSKSHNGKKGQDE